MFIEYDSEEWYRVLFPDDKSKAEAFDKLAEMYYKTNFATTPKAEVDLFMFSVYLNRLYQSEDVQEQDYSDYSLSRVLGITQNRVSSFKERMELKYPREAYEWRESFKNVLPKAEFVDGKVQIYIYDQRLFTELKNVIYLLGSYSEERLTKQLIVVTPPVFVDLMVEAFDVATKEQMREELQRILEENHLDGEKYIHRKKNLKQILRDQKSEIAKAVILQAVKAIPIIGDAVAEPAKTVLDSIIKEYSKY
ncbi:MAG: hypothetical protein IK152_02380 [Lachnospiraceae bacterium]|nr:hypothetical protein [Lachnospiraceae bacterium]